MRSLLVACLCLASLAPVRARGADDGVRLADEAVQRLCDKYEGEPAFLKDGEIARLNCGWIRKMAETAPGNLTFYRGIVASAGTMKGLKELRRKGQLPSDFDCGQFRPKAVGAEQVLVCNSDVGVVVPYVFRAGKDGRLRSVEFRAPYRKIYRVAYEGAVKRGMMTELYDAFVEVHADMFLEAARQTAAAEDEVRVEGDELFVRILRPR